MRHSASFGPKQLGVSFIELPAAYILLYTSQTRPQSFTRHQVVVTMYRPLMCEPRTSCGCSSMLALELNLRSTDGLLGRNINALGNITVVVTTLWYITTAVRFSLFFLMKCHTHSPPQNPRTYDPVLLPTMMIFVALIACRHRRWLVPAEASLLLWTACMEQAERQTAASKSDCAK